MIQAHIKNYVSEYLFDGQFVGYLEADQIIDHYLDSIERGQRYPVFLEDGQEEIFFSWIDQPLDSERLKRNVKRIDFISYSCRSLDQFRKVLKSLEKTTDTIYLRLLKDHPLCPLMNGDFLGWQEYAEKKMLKLDLSHYQQIPPKGSQIQFWEGIQSLKQEQVIREIAKESFTMSRYIRDPHFPEGFGREVYSSWIGNSLKKPKNVLCFISGGTVCGFLSFTLKSWPNSLSYAFVDLIAVDEKVQQRSIATQLMEFFCHYLRQQGVSVLYANVDSQNEKSLRFFLKNGFTLFQELKEYHWWRNL